MSKSSVVFFSFEGERMCFMHVLLNAIDLHEKGVRSRLVLEGASTKFVKELIEEGNPVFKKVMDLDLIDSVCKACANQMGVLDYIIEKTDLTLNGEMGGHPPMATYILEGYEVIVM